MVPVNPLWSWILGRREALANFIWNVRYDLKRTIKRFRLHVYAFAVFALGLVDVLDPYALQSIVPERFQGYVFVGLGVVAFLLRKVSEHPPVVTTTAFGEGVPHPDEVAHAAMDGDPPVKD